MSLKDDIIALINSAYRHDKFINDFTEAISTVFNRLIVICESIRNNTFFDSLDMNGVLWWEKHLKITPTDNDLIYRRSKIEAKWKSSRHNGVKLIQDTCDAWRNGKVKVDFCRAIRKSEIDNVLTKSELETFKKERFINDGFILIELIDAYGIPPDLEKLKAEVEEIKPAHLIVKWVYNFLLKKDIDGVFTKSEMETKTKNLFCYISKGD